MMVHQAGAGPEPIPCKKLCVENLRDGIMFALSAGAKSAAAKVAQRIRDEVWAWLSNLHIRTEEICYDIRMG
jgi:hypothetical protein